MTSRRYSDENFSTRNATKTSDNSCGNAPVTSLREARARKMQSKPDGWVSSCDPSSTGHSGNKEGSVDSGKSSSLMPSESDLVREFEESENNESGAGGTEDSQNPGSTQAVDEVDEETLGTIDVALQTADDSSYVLDDETKFITTVIFNKDNN